MNPALLLQRLKAQPGHSPAKPKVPKKEKLERISSSDLSYLKRRAVLHVRELIAEFFPNGRLTPGGYWITPELRISISTGCFWKNGGVHSRRPAGDVLTLFLVGAGFIVPEERAVVTNGIQVLKDRLSSPTGYRLPEGAFHRGVESLSTWLEQFP